MFSLVEATNEYLIRRNAINASTGVHFYPSEASVVINAGGIRKILGCCLRQAYFRCTGVPGKEYTPRTELQFELGKATEKMLVDKWKKMGIYEGESIRWLDEEHNISGELDALIRSPDGNIYCVEVKSIHGYQARKEIIGTTHTAGKPKDSHLLQTLVYTYHFRDQITGSKMIYISRDNADIAEYDIRVIPDDVSGTLLWRPEINGVPCMSFTMEDIYARYAALKEHLAIGAAPEREFELYYGDERIERDYAAKALSRAKYTKWKKNGIRPGDWNCVGPDTLVQMANGIFKPICNIEAGEKVISLDGPAKVTRVGSRKPTETCYKVKPIGMLDTICTGNHEWLVGEWDKNEKYYNGKGFIPHFVKTTDLITASVPYSLPEIMALIVPIHQPYEGIKLTQDQCELLGYYIAEGCLANQQDGIYYQVIFTLNTNEEDLAQRIIRLATELFSCNFTNEIIEDSRPEHEGWKYRKVRFYSVAMANFFRTHCPGQKAIYKRLSTSVMGAEAECILRFLYAAEAGDGSHDGNRSILSTSSRILCDQYQQLYWRLGIPAIAQYANKPGLHLGYKSHQGYRVQYEGDIGNTVRLTQIGGQPVALMRIRSVEETSSPEEVWDIEVDSPTHTFATESGLVHNCSYCPFKQSCWGTGVVAEEPEEEENE